MSEPKTIYLQPECCADPETKLREIIEIYAGMDGFKPETAPEAYLLRIVEQMYRTAISGLDCDE